MSKKAQGPPTSSIKTENEERKHSPRNQLLNMESTLGTAIEWRTNDIEPNDTSSLAP